MIISLNSPVHFIPFVFPLNQQGMMVKERFLPRIIQHVVLGWWDPIGLVVRHDSLLILVEL